MTHFSSITHKLPNAWGELMKSHEIPHKEKEVDQNRFFPCCPTDGQKCSAEIFWTFGFAAWTDHGSSEKWIYTNRVCLNTFFLHYF